MKILKKQLRAALARDTGDDTHSVHMTKNLSKKISLKKIQKKQMSKNKAMMHDKGTKDKTAKEEHVKRQNIAYLKRTRG